jgi:tetratricopeptide (TPR) repeat protein
VRSAESPTGWAFRGSNEAAWRAASRALHVAPAAFRVLTYDFLQRIAHIDYHRVRYGVAGEQHFVGSVALVEDTMAFVPYPRAEAAQRVPPETYGVALQFNRDRMLALLEALVRHLPESAAVFEAYAGVLETRGEINGTPYGRYSALSALERAATLSKSPDQRIRLAAADVRLHLKLGDFARATATADSVLNDQRNPTLAEARWLAGLAAYLGRPTLAARYMRLAERRDDLTNPEPLPTADDALAALIIRAALGICDDSLRTLTRSVDQALDIYVSPARRQAVRDKLLERATGLALSCTGPAPATLISRPAIALTKVAQVAARGDRAGVIRMLDSLERVRRAIPRGSMSFDSLLEEAWLADFAGAPARAAQLLDVELTALPALSVHIVMEPGMAAAVGRGMAYRAELAARLGDPSTAAMWAGRVLTVWSHAERNLEPTLKRMRRLVNRQSLQ